MVKKTSKKKLFEKIEDDIIIYLRSGNLSLNPYLKKLDLNIEGLEQLLNIHFLMDSNVQNYIHSLSYNMRKFNSSVTSKESLNRSVIKGRVSWGKTIQVRSNINPKDKSIFMCNENFKNYNTNENIVLKEFIEILYNIFNTYDVSQLAKYKSLDVIKFRESIERIYLKNIYLSRVNLKKHKLNNRMIENVSNNRNQLYSEAAKLLKFYRKIISLDEETIRNMFKTTFIEVADHSTLFELYWVLKIIKDNSQNKTLYVLDGDKSTKVASWEKNNYLYTIYHNSSGSQDISFNVNIDEIRGVENEVTEKQIKIIEETNDLAKKIFHGVEDKYSLLYNGRPDILIEIRELLTGDLKEIIVGEVKHTLDKNYAIEGLKELLEYVNFIKTKTASGFRYISNQQGITVKGILCLDNIQVNKIKSPLISVVTMTDDVDLNIDLLFSSAECHEHTA